MLSSTRRSSTNTWRTCRTSCSSRRVHTVVYDSQYPAYCRVACIHTRPSCPATTTTCALEEAGPQARQGRAPRGVWWLQVLESKSKKQMAQDTKSPGGKVRTPPKPPRPFLPSGSARDGRARLRGVQRSNTEGSPHCVRAKHTRRSCNTPPAAFCSAPASPQAKAKAKAKRKRTCGSPLPRAAPCRDPTLQTVRGSQCRPPPMPPCFEEKQFPELSLLFRSRGMRTCAGTTRRRAWRA